MHEYIEGLIEEIMKKIDTDRETIARLQNEVTEATKILSELRTLK